MLRLGKASYFARVLACEGLPAVRNVSDARCRTSVDDPNIHAGMHESLFYTVPPVTVTQLFTLGGIPKSYENQAKVFRETSFMVRKPALELINHMKTADYSRPVIRYVVYGELGNGKSLTLAHIVHYGMNSGHLLVHIPWAPDWFQYSAETAASSSRAGFIDTPLSAAKWLGHFRLQNQHLLRNPDLVVSNEYIWSKREITSPGSSVLELVNLGINRIKYASEIVVALMKEIKILSTAGKCKTLVAIDGFNVFFGKKCKLKGEDGQFVAQSRVVLTEAFLSITQADWCNGSVVLVVDRYAFPEEKNFDSDLPLLQLGKEGFEHLDPFVPVYVPGYNEKEFHSCLDYYIDRHWIQSEKANTEEGRIELMYLSVNNPYQLMNICNPL